MTEETQPTDVPSYITPVSERPPDQRPTRVERSVERVRELRADGSLATLGGLAAIALAIRHAVGGRRRALLYGVAGAALVGRGRRQRRDGESTRRGADAEFEALDAGGDTDRERVRFTDEADEPRSKPGLDEESDPRRFEGDEVVEIDVSDDAVADEPGEATGPDPEQAQPTQTEATEPETGPEGAEPTDEGDEASTENDADADAEDDAEADATDDADADATDDADADATDDADEAESTE